MRLFNKALIKLHPDMKGLSLVEVLIGVGILGFLGVGLMSALDTNSKATGILDEKITGSHLASAHIEILRSLPFDDSYNLSGNVTVPAHYSVILETECSTDSENFVPCTGAPEQTFQRITIIVQHDERPVYSTCTFKTDF